MRGFAWGWSTDCLDTDISNLDKILDSSTLVSALVEDGVFDEKVWLPVAVYSEILWNPNRSIEEIITEKALIPDVYFA